MVVEVSMSISVHTNVDSMTALQHLNTLSHESAEVRTRIATGLKVSGVKDSSTIWAIAQGMRASNESRGAAMQSVNLATGVVEVALAAAEGISNLMIEMKEKLVAATDTSLDENGWRALMSEYIVLGNEIRNLSENASFNGKNLLAAGADDLSVLVSDNPSITMTVSAENFSDGAGIVDVGLAGVLPYADDSVITAQPDQAMVAAFETSMESVNASLSRLGTSLRGLEVSKELLTKQIDAVDSGIGALVDADMGKEKARLEALQVRQQLSSQALAVANQSPTMLMGLFR